MVNQLTQSDFQNGLSDAPTRSGLLTVASLPEYGGAVAFGHNGSTTSYALKTYIPLAGTVNTVCAVVQMTDLTSPTWSGSLTGVGTPFALVGNGQVPAAGGSEYTVAALPNNTYLVAWTFTASGTVGNNGLYKYATNNNRTFKATRFGLINGSFTAQQIANAGGIPLTTTAPAGQTVGNFAWQFASNNAAFSSTMTTPSEGYCVGGALCINSVYTHTLLGGSGADGDSIPGVWVVRQSTGAIRISVGNGMTRNSLLSQPSPVSTPFIASAGWNLSRIFTGVNGTEVSIPNSINCATQRTISVGFNGLSMIGSLFAQLWVLGVTPSPEERDLLRWLVATLSGVTMEFNPSEMFIGNVQGVWYDPSDISTLFQDSAGTIPVTSVGQPVGRMLDKSGRGNHAFQTVNADRPLLGQDSGGRFCLYNNGTNYWMQTNAIDFTGTDKITIISGVRKMNDTATGVVAELGTDSFSTNGSFGMFAPAGSGSFSYRVQTRGTVTSAAGGTAFAPGADTAVITAQIGISTDSVSLRRNGVSVGVAATDLGSGNYGNLPLFLFRRAGLTLPFNGNFYGLLIPGSSFTSDQISSAERWMAQKTGAAL